MNTDIIEELSEECASSNNNTDESYLLYYEPFSNNTNVTSHLILRDLNAKSHRKSKAKPYKEVSMKPYMKRMLA
jgi:hypothetical protein